MKMDNSWKKNNLLESNDNGDRVACYVGTYGKYNDGSIDGKWLYPADYDTLEDFYDACRELHSDEEDPEFMIQDVENLPSDLYSESGLSQEAFDYAKWIDEPSNDAGAAEAYMDLFGEWDPDSFEDRYQGHYDSLTDYCQEFVDSCGGIGEAVRDPEIYFDYEHFGKELKWDLDENEESDQYYLDMDDYEAGERFIEDVYGGVSALAKESPETVEAYFDWDAYARDVSYDVAEEDGYVFFNN